MKHVYFDSDRLSLLVEWLRKYPADRYNVLIGTNTNQDIHSVLSFVILADLQLGLWLTKKLVNSEIRLMIFRKLDLPEGVELD